MSEIPAAALASVIETEKKALVVAKFGAPWCAPCRRVTAPFAEYARQCASAGSSVKCVSINIDDLDEEARDRYGVQKIPTFVVWFEGQRVDHRQTSDMIEVRTLVSLCFEWVTATHPTN